MKPFSLDWWWVRYNVAQGLFEYYAEISSYFDESIALDEKCIRDRLKATHYVDLRDYIRKRIEAKVIDDANRCKCGQYMDERYSPCCSLECWHEQFSGVPK